MPRAQEMVWYELWGGEADPRLRLLQLPEEYYCPLRRGRDRTRQLGPPIVGPVLAPRTWPRWSTSWGRYRCKALHGHLSAADLKLANLSHFAHRPHAGASAG